MRDAYVPWPRFDRRTLLLLLDDQQRLLLCGSCCRGWTVPEIRLGSNTDFLGEANRFLTERFGLPDPRCRASMGCTRPATRKAGNTTAPQHPAPTSRGSATRSPRPGRRPDPPILVGDRRS